MPNTCELSESTVNCTEPKTLTGFSQTARSQAARLSVCDRTDTTTAGVVTGANSSGVVRVEQGKPHISPRVRKANRKER